jgi:TetR/AcrR family transcriptional regulator, tetracycline repressor protein
MARRPVLGSVRRKPPALTRESIAGAAARLLEREGYEALTMRSLAAELGIQAASLYWHVADREELEDLLFDALLSDLGLVVAGRDWREDLSSLAHQLLAHLTGKRDAQRVIAGRFVLGPHLLRHLECILGVLRRGGLDGRDAAYALYALLTYVNGFVLFQRNALSHTRASGVERREVLGQLREQFLALPTDRYPHSVALAEALTAEDPTGRFDFGLALLIDGLAALSHDAARR